MNKKLKKLFSMMLCMVMLVTSFSFSYAEGNKVVIDNKDVYISQLTSNSILVKSEDEKSVIRVNNYGDITRTDVYNLETGENYYFIRNDKNDTLYSSMTDKTINIKDFSGEEKLSERSLISLFGVKKERYIRTDRLSTRTIANAINGVVTVTAIISFLATFFTSGGATLTLGSVSAITSFLAKMGNSGINYALTNYDYLVWDVYEVEASSVKGGKRYYFTAERYWNFRFQ